LRCASSLALSCLIAGCAAFSPQRAADDAAAAAGFVREELPAGGFHLLAYRRFEAGDRLTLYIESDGAPWPRRDRPPEDPTPRVPLALRLALEHPGGSVAWVSRPCQFLSEAELARCDSRYWRRARYGEDVVQALDAAAGQLLRESGARRLVLIGYSGGGAVAALVAARRSDVELLVTVGGVLDTTAWTAAHGVTPLDQSLNPADHAASLHATRQAHLVGDADAVTPPFLAESFAARAGPRARVLRLSARDHDCCWERDWTQLISRILEDSP